MVAPRPTAPSAQVRPPWRSTMRWTLARPMPVPQRPQRGPQVMSGRVGKGRQVLVGPFQVHGALPHPLFQGGIRGPDLPGPPERLAFGVFAGRDVPVDLQESKQGPVRPALRRPAALHDDGPPVGAAVGKLAVPAAIPGRAGLDAGHRLGKLRAEQVVGFAADRLSPGEAMGIRGACVPVRDLPVQGADENRVVGQLQQRSLARDDLFPAPSCLWISRSSACDGWPRRARRTGTRSAGQSRSVPARKTP
jgi:hypothetical protein